jgi:CubicO group peptidase (beta-lactamase class C family)
MKDYGDEFDYRRDYTEAELLDVAMQLPLDFEPGTQWSYSNSGYMVLGVLVSDLAGEHWSEFLADEIFEPGGMETARVITEAGIVPRRAAGYERGPAGELSNQAWVAPSFNTQADGALYFSLRDLAAWERVLGRRGLLDEESYTAWWTPVVLEGGEPYPYGFGWNISDQRGRRVIEHGGAWQGFKTYFARYVEDGLTVAVLANISTVDPGLLAHEIAGRLDRDLALPAVDDAGTEDAPLLRDLRDVLEAWADWRVSAHMGHALARTHSGSSREAWDRRTVAERLDAATGFGVLDEDDLAGKGLERRGAVIERIVYCVLEADDSRYRYRFYLSADGKVVDFGEI